MKKINKDKQIRIEEITLGLNERESGIKEKILKTLEIKSEDVLSYQIVKRAIDSRHKRNILLVFSVNIEVENQKKFLASLDEVKIIRHKIRLVESFDYEIKIVSKDNKRKRPIVIGTGPSGLFAGLLLAKAGLRPTIVERGKDVDSRIKDVKTFFSKGKLNSESNIQFGEGGAGTFSDGKLYTLINDPRKKFIFEEMIKAGALKEIATDAHPHIGTDKLRKIVKNIRKEIIRLGGEVRFETCLTDLEIKKDKIENVVFNNNEKISVSELVLAIGHSARDTYQMLYEKKIKMSAKPFAMGVRIEHNAIALNKAQYGDFYNHSKLPTARYKLVAHMSGLRSVYTFCMCPGGYVVAAASEEGMLAINGMSEYAQDGKNSNSALLVSIIPSDFNSDHPLAGVEFQREWEKKAFMAGGGEYRAPVQLVGDFIKNKSSQKIKSIKPTYMPGVTPTSLDNCLPNFVIESLKKAISELNKKINGFSNPDAVLTGIESRSSSPVRIIRGATFQSNIRGIYPTGEGSGYAGGIITSAIDGLKVAEVIIDKYLK